MGVGCLPSKLSDLADDAVCGAVCDVCHRYSDGVTYGELFLQNEYEMSCYNLDEADVAEQRQRFALCEAEVGDRGSSRLSSPLQCIFASCARDVYGTLDRASVALNQLEVLRA